MGVYIYQNVKRQAGQDEVDVTLPGESTPRINAIVFSGLTSSGPPIAVPPTLIPRTGVLEPQKDAFSGVYRFPRFQRQDSRRPHKALSRLRSPPKLEKQVLKVVFADANCGRVK